MTKEFIDFVLTHENEDTARLLLSAARYPGIDMPLAVQQIEGRRTAREKWPSLLKCEEFIYPPRLNREQSSSETAAEHKASLVEGGRCADLTGGMGIDTLAFARVAAQVDYVEHDASLCALMEHNLKVLGVDNVRIHCADSIEWLATASRYDLLFIDPARRDKQGRKVAAFEDCTPDILAHQKLLQDKSREILVKASPMIDITLGTNQLGNVSDIYVIAVHGECKEVLFRCGQTDGEPHIHCHHLHDGVTDDLVFTREEEAKTQACYASEVKKYLYEPNAALMKAGPFKLLNQIENVEKLARNTHLYTSDTFIQHFPGRIFSVLAKIRLTRKEIQEWVPDGRAHVVTRNYPTEAATLQHQLGLKEGGDTYVIATTVGSQLCGFLCSRI